MENRIRTHCNECSGLTNHQTLFSKSVVVDRIDVDSKKFKLTKCEEEYCVVECLGCNSLSFLIISTFEGKESKVENLPDSYDSYNSLLGSLADEDVVQLPKVIHDLYTEVEEAIDNYSLVLAGIGLRTLVEAVCIYQIFQGQTYKPR